MPKSFSVTDFTKDAILGVLQEFFSNENNAGEFLWRADIKQSKILIADKYTLNLEDVEKKPSIVVIRGAQSWGRRGIDQFQGWEGPNTGSRHTDIILGTFNCTCMSANGLEAESLADTVFAFFSFFKKVLRSKVPALQDLQGVALGEELVAVSDSKQDVSVVPVTISTAFQWSWLVEQRGKPVENVNVTTRESHGTTKNGQAFDKFLASARPKFVA